MRWLCAFLLAGVVSALIDKVVVENEERHAFHMRSFGFWAGGHFEATITDFRLMIPHDYVQPAEGKFRIALVLQSSPTDAGVIPVDEQGGEVCLHESPAMEGAFLISLESRQHWGKVQVDKVITEPGYYHLYFSNCEVGTHATFNIHVEEYNVDPKGNKIYLSAGRASLPTWYFVICCMFAALLLVWSKVLCANRPKNSANGERTIGNNRKIHWLMLVVLVLKVATLFFESFKEYSLKVNGVNNGWSGFYYFFSFLKGMMFFAVIVLIGTGWSSVKEGFCERDKQILLAVLMVQLMVNIAAVVVDDESSFYASWVKWRNIFHLMDMICCCVILLPIVWSIRAQRASMSGKEADPKDVKKLERLKNFRTFYLLVVSYVYFTRIIVFLLEATLPFEISWLSNILSEAASFAFYTSTGWLFRPQKYNPYMAVGKDDDDWNEDDEGVELASVAEP